MWAKPSAKVMIADQNRVVQELLSAVVSRIKIHYNESSVAAAYTVE